MKFEKISNDKIRIIFNKKDLIEKNIDFHSFMSNSIESQDLFLYALEEAEKEFGFSTKNSQIRVEALASSTGDFIVTVTRIISALQKNDSLLPSINSSQRVLKRKPSISRKNLKLNSAPLIYKFSSFDNFCDFSSFCLYYFPSEKQTFTKKSMLFLYKNDYYLAFSSVNSKNTYVEKLLNLLTEFSTPIRNSNLFFYELQEYATTIFKSNALKKCNDYFCTKS